MNATSAGGIVFQGDKICFMVFPNGKLSFPKGTPEVGETVEQTALREVHEETGLSGLRIVNKIGVVTRPGEDRKHHKILKDIHLFLMETADFTQQNQDEVTEWLTFEEAKPRLFEEEREFLQNYLNLYHSPSETTSN